MSDVDSSKYTGLRYPTRYGCVYRAYDAEGALLYIGSTCDFERRKYLHTQTSIWMPQVAKWRVRW